MRTNDDLWRDVDQSMSALETETDHHRQPPEHANLMFKMLRVMVTLAKIGDQSTRRVVHLTWALLALTFVLLVVAIVQTVWMFYSK